MGVLAWFRRRGEEAQQPAGEPADAAEDGGSEGARGTEDPPERRPEAGPSSGSSADPADPAVVADGEAVGIPQQSSAPQAADNGTGESARP
ncbi:hypothetical protein GCM10009716_34820 [Streptomyces sodiiphilus]|uniref:Gliding motility protein n=1 Tax=Streptomyces sodiiphilus TaxID=226217 RepID=A0ABN2PJI7_9ACTN